MRELRERAEPALRILCLILAGAVLYEVAGMAIRWNPFRGVTVPDLPALTSATNAPAGGPHGTNHIASAAIKGTNGAPRPSSTNSTLTISNQTMVVANTNSVSTPVPAGRGTNLTALAETRLTSTNAATNAVASSTSNAVASAVVGVATNVVTDAATKIHAARLMTYHCAWKLDRGQDVRQEISMIKGFATEMAYEVVDHAMQTFGAMGMTKELPLQLMSTKLRTMRIYDGPTEVHKWVVARNLLGGKR